MRMGGKAGEVKNSGRKAGAIMDTGRNSGATKAGKGRDRHSLACGQTCDDAPKKVQKLLQSHKGLKRTSLLRNLSRSAWLENCFWPPCKRHRQNAQINLAWHAQPWRDE